MSAVRTMADLYEGAEITPVKKVEEMPNQKLGVTPEQATELALKGGLSNFAIILGDWNLRSTEITSLPDNVHITKSLNLFASPLTSLPSGLNVGENLSLFASSIKSLSSGLRIGGDLDLRGSKVGSLPKDIVVYGNVLTSCEFVLPKGVKGKLVVG